MNISTVHFALLLFLGVLQVGLSNKTDSSEARLFLHGLKHGGHSDIDFNFKLPLPPKIPDPTYTFGFALHDFIPFKTWISLNPVTLIHNIWILSYKVLGFLYNFLESLFLLVKNTVDIFKLWGAYYALKKLDFRHVGWGGNNNNHHEGGDGGNFHGHIGEEEW